ncbi:MAG: CRISPR-associated endonuclease Cas2, partial [Parcubacteria group bacterium CG11_big_fil_rev_8_21_14_0_20_41_14]
LQNILEEVELRYKKHFRNADSVIAVSLCKACKDKMVRYGYAKNDEKEVVIFE